MIPLTNRSQKLFSYTGQSPRYYQDVTSQKGTKLKLADPDFNRIALALMNMEAVQGGAAAHWGGPSAFAELVSALYGVVFHLSELYQKPWYDLFHLINDAGHCENGLYVLKANYGLGGLNFKTLKGFRSLNSHLTGHGEAHLFPEGVYLSNGPLGSTLAQAQGLCMADKLQNNPHRKTVVLMSDGACMEGEVKEALASLTGLSQKQQINPLIVAVSDNDTKLSGRISKDSFPMDPFFESLKALGWESLPLQDAHNLKACVDVWEEVLTRPPASFKKPVFIRAKTLKGYGVKATENLRNGGHGFPLKNTASLSAFIHEICGEKKLPLEFKNWCKDLQKSDALSSSGPKSPSSSSGEGGKKRIKIQKGVSEALIQAKDKEALPLVSVSSDLMGSTGVGDFRKKFPECSFDMGVAEANMISVAAGFSKQGFIPVVDTFAQFGITKGALPLFMASLSEAPVVAFFSHTGFQDAADGASHQTLNYLAQTQALPRTEVYCLSCAEEAYALTLQALRAFVQNRKEGKVPPSFIFFLGRENFPPSFLPSGYHYQLAKAQIIPPHTENKGGADFPVQELSLVTCGPLLEEVLKARQILAQNKIKALVVNLPLVNRPDLKTLKTCLQQSQGRILTVEDHKLLGGMGQILAHQLLLEGVKTDMCSLGVKQDFGRSAYRSHDLYEKSGLTAPHIVKAVFKKWPFLKNH